MSTDQPPAFIVSADPDYLPAAGAELRAAFPGATVTPIGPDAARLTGVPDDVAAVAARCREWPVVFVRHLMAERAMLPLAAVRRDKRAVSRAVAELLAGTTTGADSVDTGVAEAGDAAADGHAVAADGNAAGSSLVAAGPIALQVWVSGESPLAYGTEELWHHVADELGRTGLTIQRSGADWTVGLCVSQEGISVGLTPALPGHADWPGGRVRLRKDPDQISRAEFKLEELLSLGIVSLPEEGVAVDLGAAPGGWSRVLRRAGLRVIAVDPGALDPRLAEDPGIEHVPMTAAPFLARSRDTYDLVVNDMRMIPALSCEVMLAAAARLRPGGLGIMSLKLTPHYGLTTVDRALAALRQAYEVEFARQLYHNRNEATVVVRR